MGRPEQREHNRKKAAESCQRLDGFFAPQKRKAENDGYEDEQDKSKQGKIFSSNNIN